MALYINGNKSLGGIEVIHLTQAEYDALSNTKKYDDKVYMIEDTNGNGSQFQPVIYSEDEREIGVWIDGKPLYQKTLKLSNTISISSESWGNVATLSEQLDINYAEGVYNTGSETVYYVLGANCDTNKLLTVLNYRNQQIELNEITLRYTKPTDTAGSGTWTPQGVPAVHYSTDEQVIGTWVDGSTIYQKTFSFTPTSNSFYIDVSSLNIDKIIESTGSVFQSYGNTVPLPYGTTSNDYAIAYYNSNDEKLQISEASGQDNYNLNVQWIVTWKYTKAIT